MVPTSEGDVRVGWRSAYAAGWLLGFLLLVGMFALPKNLYCANSYSASGEVSTGVHYREWTGYLAALVFLAVTLVTPLVASRLGRNWLLVLIVPALLLAGLAALLADLSSFDCPIV